MNSQEIHGMSRRQLRESLEDNQRKLSEVRFQLETRKSKQHHQVPALKKDIARLMTAIRERELIAAYGGGVEEDDELDAVSVASQQEPRRRGLFARLGRGR